MNFSNVMIFNKIKPEYKTALKISELHANLQFSSNNNNNNKKQKYMVYIIYLLSKLFSLHSFLYFIPL